MKHILLYESWGEESKIILENSSGKIVVSSRYGKIENILNETQESFPFFEGQLVTVFMRSWACARNFKWNGEAPCNQKA